MNELIENVFCCIFATVYAIIIFPFLLLKSR